MEPPMSLRSFPICLLYAARFMSTCLRHIYQLWCQKGHRIPGPHACILSTRFTSVLSRINPRLQSPGSVLTRSVGGCTYASLKTHFWICDKRRIASVGPPRTWGHRDYGYNVVTFEVGWLLRKSFPTVVALSLLVGGHEISHARGGDLAFDRGSRCIKENGFP